MIRAVFLDLGNVLISFDNRRFFRNLLPYSPLSQDEIGQRFVESPLASLYECGKISTRQFYLEMCGLLQATVDEVRFFRAWTSIFALTPNVDLPFLQGLARHYTLVLVSNTNAAHFAFVRRRFKLFRAFHHFALSFLAGAKKPEPEIYLAALNMSGIPASQTFYADDIEEYVEAGRGLGLCAARAQSGKELVEQMAAHGIH
ncbi:MAG: HAD family hydrolase [Terriglobia bacterium]